MLLLDILFLNSRCMHDTSIRLRSSILETCVGNLTVLLWRQSADKACRQGLQRGTAHHQDENHMEHTTYVFEDDIWRA